MQAGRPSVTARGVARRRAEHQLRDHPRVLDDPLALRILAAEDAAALGTRLDEPDTAVSRGMRAFMAVRSRYAEDNLAKAVARGVTQYVVLGAGLDTFAYRNPFTGLRVFEVDHPATQAWKRQLLAEAGIFVPDTVTYVPVDFEHQTLDASLGEAGFALGEPAFFSWLGVTPYLRPETTMATFELIHGMCRANAVAFDYAVPRERLGVWGRMAFDALAERVARAGEPFQGFFDPGELAGSLGRMGYGEVEDLDSEAINARYFAGRADALRIGGNLGRLMCAVGTG
jgi:methyltransferase (TIGR00027 family)